MTPQDDKVPGLLKLSWQASFVLGLITLILGIIVAFRPTLSLSVIAVLLGIAMIASGAYHLTRAFDGQEHERVWRGISGVVFILVGLALIRHLNLTVALVGLFIGFTWIIQGIAALFVGVSGRGQRVSTGWSLFFGALSLIAGIVVVSSPIRSVAALTIFMGIWLIVMGLMEMIDAVVFRRAASQMASRQVSVPGQRGAEKERAEGAARAAAGEGPGRPGGTGGAG